MPRYCPPRQLEPWRREEAGANPARSRHCVRRASRRESDTSPSRRPTPRDARARRRPREQRRPADHHTGGDRLSPAPESSSIGGGGPDTLAAALAACGVRVGFEASADRAFAGSIPDYLAAIGALIATDDPMIAASYGFQTVPSRIAAVVLTGAAALGAAPPVELAGLRW